MNWKKNPWLRTCRRFLVVFITGAMASFMIQTGYTKEELIIIMITASICGLEKYIRELIPKQAGENTAGK